MKGLWMTRAALAAALLCGTAAAIPAVQAQSATPQFAEHPFSGYGSAQLLGVRNGVDPVSGEDVYLVDVAVRHIGRGSYLLKDHLRMRWRVGGPTGQFVTSRYISRDGSPFPNDLTMHPGLVMTVSYLVPRRDDLEFAVLEHPTNHGTIFTFERLRPAQLDAIRDGRSPDGPVSQPPAPVPSPPPAPTPSPSPEPSPASTPGGISVPGGASAFQTYGPWQFKVDQLERGPDGIVQAVVTVRNDSQRQLPFTITDLDAYLIDENGTTTQRLGNLYRANPGGPVDSLERQSATVYLEPGDQYRGRIVFHNSRGFTPVALRLKEPVVSQVVRTFPMR